MFQKKRVIFKLITFKLCSLTLKCFNVVIKFLTVFHMTKCTEDVKQVSMNIFGDETFLVGKDKC